MTDEAVISANNVSPPQDASAAFQYGGHPPGSGWVVPNTLSAIAGNGGLSAGPYNAFAYASASGLDVTIDTGEAMVAGSPIARDTQSVVTLASSTANQTVYAGYHPNSTDSVTVGVDSAFSSGAVRVPLHSFDTNSTDVTGNVDERVQGPVVAVRNDRYETSDGSGTAVDKADSADTAGDASTLSGSPESAFAKLAQNETVSGSWDFNDTVEIHSPSGHLDFKESDTSTNDFYRVEYQGGSLYIQPWDASANTHINAITVESNGRVNFSGNVIAGGKMTVRRGTTVTSIGERKIYVDSSFPGEAQDGDILLKPE